MLVPDVSTPRAACAAVLVVVCTNTVSFDLTVHGDHALSDCTGLVYCYAHCMSPFVPCHLAMTHQIQWPAPADLIA